MLRMLSGANFSFSTQHLLDLNNSLSVHQLTAFTTLVSAQKAMFSKKPDYFAHKLTLNSGSSQNIVPKRQINNLQVKAELTVSRGGFFYRACTLWNMLPAEMKQMMTPLNFRNKVKNWVKKYISIIPP